MAEQAIVNPPTVVELIWEHDLVFAGTSGDVSMTLDSASHAGPSPMQALAFGLAACMAMDVVHILKKGRHDLKGLRADLVGTRATEDAAPLHGDHASLHGHRHGPGRAGCARHRAVARQVLLGVAFARQDIPFDVTFSVSPGV